MSFMNVSGINSIKLSEILEKIAIADADGDGNLNAEEIATINLSYNISEGMTVSQAQSTAQEEYQKEFVQSNKVINSAPPKMAEKSENQGKKLDLVA